MNDGCDICGTPATHGSQDIIEVNPPVVDKNGILWRRHIGLGIRLGCKNHKAGLEHYWVLEDIDYPDADYIALQLYKNDLSCIYV